MPSLPPPARSAKSSGSKGVCNLLGMFSILLFPIEKLCLVDRPLHPPKCDKIELADRYNYQAKRSIS